MRIGKHAKRNTIVKYQEAKNNRTSEEEYDRHFFFTNGANSDFFIFGC